MIWLIGVAILLFIATIVGLFVWLRRLRAKKVAAFSAFASQRGWEFTESEHRWVGAYDAFEPFGRGQRRDAEWILEGDDDGWFRIFQYHYVEIRTNGKGSREEAHYFHRVGVAATYLDAPDLTIVPEHVLHKIGDALGREDIDFESDAFSRKFWVRCKDRRFAYDIITPAMMEMLMQHKGWKWEWRGPVLMIHESGRLKLQHVQPMLDMLNAFRTRIPRHVRAEASN